MKKGLIIIILATIVFVKLVKAEEFVIPENAIRLRVVANSNSEYDQKIKEKVRDSVQDSMYNLLKDTKGIDDARNIINNNINKIDNNIAQLLATENYKKGHTINFSNNYFPEKVYKGVKYDEGYYESVKVTLGEGLGDNWWCVLFPPLCLIEAEESTEVEYKFFLKELINKYF